MLEDVRPWTQMLQLSWRPELRFFEERTQLLRELEDVDLLEAFIWQGGLVGARTGTYEAINVQASGLGLYVTSPRSDLERVKKALKIVLKRVEPKDVTLSTLMMQFLLPIEVDPIVGQRVTAERQVPEDLHPLTSPRDWATILDGISPSLRTQFTVEYGLVRPEEMEDRLGRHVGRMTPGFLPFEQALPVPPLDTEQLPPAAAFFDTVWPDIQEALGDGDVSEQAVSLWMGAVAEAETFAHRMTSELGFTVPATEETRAHQ